MTPITQTAVPHLSYSAASTLVRYSPRHAWLEHRLLGNQRGEPTAAQIKGTAIGSLLQGGSAEVVMVPFDDFRTNAAREMRDAALAEGKTPITMRQMEQLGAAADAIRANLLDLGIVLDGQSEVPLEWEEESRSGPVACRGRLDHVKGLDIYELKSIGTASLEACRRQLYAMAYDVQHAAYTSGWGKSFPEKAGRERFTFLFFELEPPYSVTPLKLSGVFRELGWRRWRRAAEVWAECLASGVWPHYADRTLEVEPPRWALLAEEEAEGEPDGTFI